MTHLQRRADVRAVTRRNKTAIVEVGITACGALSHHLDPRRRPSASAAEACRAAVEDAGLAAEAVDGMSIWPPAKRSAD